MTPNMITMAGVAVTFGAAGLIAFGHLRWAAIVLAFAGTFDILDGALARATNRSYPYGAFLDSTTDRYAEGAIYVGIATYLLFQHPVSGLWMQVGVLACFVALAGSYLVSYVRARAQSLGYRCDSGLFARPERVVVTVVGLIIGRPEPLIVVVAVLAVVTNFTALQRIFEVYGQARAERRALKKAGAPAPAPTGTRAGRPGGEGTA
ncbi:MAG: CDP-alcohol phosphatidyltransferase family protein [Candidatus Dormibacteraeota bacterium]|nr:CDP-alcohol phosphatidyltransferase family protein [Candidatus Dormibacteraeota bacterium]